VPINAILPPLLLDEMSHHSQLFDEGADCLKQEKQNKRNDEVVQLSPDNESFVTKQNFFSFIIFRIHIQVERRLTDVKERNNNSK